MSDPTTKRVREQLRAVLLPGFYQDIAAAGFVKGIDVRAGAVRVGFEMCTHPMDETAAIEEGIRQAVSSLPGVKRVEIRRMEFEIALIPDVRRNPGSAGRGSARGVAADALR